MLNPIAILFRPGRVLLLCFGLLTAYLGLVGLMQPVECDDVSRVELID